MQPLSIWAFGVRNKIVTGVWIFIALWWMLSGGWNASLWARNLSAKEARTLAQRWLEKSGYFHPTLDAPEGWKIGTRTQETVSALRSREGAVLAFVCQLEPKGFVLVAADNRLNPILAFSRESYFSTQNSGDNFAVQWVYTDIASRYRAFSEGAVSAALLEKNQRLRETLLEQGVSQVEKPTQIYGPYLTSAWGQGTVDGVRVFNLFTPNHWSAGCVATALAQILYYYRWPVHGTGVHAYNEDDAGRLAVNFDSTYYDWVHMLDAYDASSTLLEREAVARLVFHCGVALNMNYESRGSTADTRDVPEALKDYFRYTGRYVNSSAADFYPLLKEEMIQERPAQLAISTQSGLGHSVAVDGYFEYNGYFHLNMGWNGKNNGWYDLAGSFDVSGYSIVNGAVLHMFPVPEIVDSTSGVRGDSLRLTWRTSLRSHPEKYELAFSLNQTNAWTTYAGTLRDTVLSIPIAQLVPSGISVGSIAFKVRGYEKGQWWGWSHETRVQIHSRHLITFQVRLGQRRLAPGEELVVRGNIPPLGGYVNTGPFEGPDSLGIYRLTVGFDYSHVGEILLFRFAIVGPNGVQMENKTRRIVILSEPNQVLPVVDFNGGTNSVFEQTANQPANTFVVYPNFPNPFQKHTRLRFAFLEGSGLQIILFNVLGEKIAGFRISGQNAQRITSFDLDFDRIQNQQGRVLPKGMYFLEYRLGNRRQVQKILFQ